MKNISQFHGIASILPNTSTIAFTKSCDILNKPYMQQIAIYVKPTKHSGDKTFVV